MATKTTPGGDHRKAVMEKRRAERKEVGRRVLAALSVASPPMTQSDLARKTGIIKSSISQAIAGQRGLDAGQIKSIAEALGVPVSTLMPGGAEPGSRSPTRPANDGDHTLSSFGSDHPIELVPEVEDYLRRFGDAVADEERRWLAVWASVERSGGVALDDKAINEYLRLRRGLAARVAAHLAARRGGGGEPQK